MLSEMKTKTPGFLFDLDGVLIDSKELHWESWDLLQKEVPDFKTDYEDFVRTFGQRNDQILKDKIPGSTPEQRKFWGERKEEIFRRLARGNIQLIPGIEDFLAAVDKASLPKIIASSTPLTNLHFLLQETSIGRYFHRYVSGEEVPRGKPAPDIFVEAARRLNLLPRQCVVLEDSPAGLTAGRMASCLVVALATTHREEDLPRTQYDLVFPSPRQLDLSKIQWAFTHWQPAAAPI